MVQKVGHDYLLAPHHARKLTPGREEHYRKILTRGFMALYASGERVNFAPWRKSSSVTDTQKA